MPLPSWSRELIALYESGAASQFLLHGNVGDIFLIPTAPEPRLGSLLDFLTATLLARFDVVLRYDLGAGLRVERGSGTFQQWPSANTLPHHASPRDAIAHLSHYFRYTANLSTATARNHHVACIITDAGLLAPAGPSALAPDFGSITLQMRDWSLDPQLSAHPLATFLICENLNDLHPILSANPRAESLQIPLPAPSEIHSAIELLRPRFPNAFQNASPAPIVLATAFEGATLAATQSLIRLRHHQTRPLRQDDLASLKKRMVERECHDLIQFVPPERTLDDVTGMDAAKAWIRQDITLWKQNILDAIPMGYLLCGPVGTGKTFLAECLGGEAGVPVVKLANFRDRWVGSTEANLERIFRLLHALGRCVVFVDEADQALGRRDSGSSDNGLSGRVYAMIAKEMSDTRHRGRILWLLASSRPDLIEVDLKRPGRIDVKIPLFPTSTLEEGWSLLRALCQKRGIHLPEAVPARLASPWPRHFTPGAAEALAVKIARQTKGSGLLPLEALAHCLSDYQPPVSETLMEHQIRLGIQEATEKTFIPAAFRHLIAGEN